MPNFKEEIMIKVPMHSIHGHGNTFVRKFVPAYDYDQLSIAFDIFFGFDVVDIELNKRVFAEYLCNYLIGRYQSGDILSSHFTYLYRYFAHKLSLLTMLRR